MKGKMRKLFALALAAIMVLAMGITASANGNEPDLGGGTPPNPSDSNNAKIVIDNAAKDETYSLYKLFDVTVAKDANNKSGYSYFLSAADYNQYGSVLETAGVGFIKSADSTRYTVSKINNIELDKLTETNMAAWAAALNTMMNSTEPVYSFQKIEKTPTVEASINGKFKVTFDGLAAGYYFVDSTLGSLCALNTSSTTVNMYEKNSIPSITKKVQEDSDEEWGGEATADFLQDVNFRLTVNTGTNKSHTSVRGDLICTDETADHVHDDSCYAWETGVDADYEIVDTLPSGMTYKYTSDVKDGLSVRIEDGNTVLEDLIKNVTYANDKLTIELKGTVVETLGQDVDIIIEYTATVTNTATVGAVGNTNNVVLTYKEQTSSASATVKTYAIGTETSNATGSVTKIDATNSNAPLAGVGFTLTKVVKVVENDVEKEVTMYAKVTADSTGNNGDVFNGWDTQVQKIYTNDKGMIYVKGLDADTYTLTETDPLPGYNALDYTITASIDKNGKVTYTENKVDGQQDVESINIANNKGAMLPSTGGIGTTIFYVVGGILVVVAGVLLITKKRMSGRD